MTNEEAIKLDDHIKDNNDALYIAYTTEACSLHNVMVWLESEWGDNSKEEADEKYYTRQISAEELHRFIGELSHGSQYQRNIAIKANSRLVEVYFDQFD